MTTITVSNDPDKYEAWPSIQQLQNKDLIIFYRTADTNTHTYEASGRIVCRKSTDQGLTWGDEITVSKHGENIDNRCNSTIVFDDDGTETILVVTVLQDDGEPAPIYKTRSTDGGVTWSTPSLVVEKRGLAPNIKELCTGELAFSAYGYDKVGEVLFLTGTIYLYKSNDGGLNWTEHIIHEDDGAGQCNETAIIETKDENGKYSGGMLAIVRANPTGNYHYRKFRSTDYGETWTEENNETGLTDIYNASKLELSRPIPDFILCTYFNGVLGTVSLMVSTDEGATWTGKYDIPLDGVAAKGYGETILLDNTWTLATVSCVNSVYSDVHISFTNFRLFKEYLTNLYRIDVSNRVSVPSRNVVVSRKSRN
jgi:hypothetical protein